MKKRLICLLTALCLALALTGPALAAEEDTMLETIRVLGILNGDQNGDLNLSAPVTRAEFVKMMAAASAYKEAVGNGYGAALFTDVKSGHWASGYIRLAVEQGWVTGYVDGSFRPDSTITLEEACAALLRLLGFDSGSLSGTFPEAQLTKARSVGLLDGLDVSRGQTLTRNDCVVLFYNLLVSENSTGTVYGTTLGCTVTDGEVDYSALITADTKGPFVASSGALSLPFDASGAAVYRNGSASSLAAVQPYDVYYYSEKFQTVWIYSSRATGTLTAVSPSTVSPASVTVAGNSYTLGTSAAVYQFSSQGSFTTGDTVTLLLGMNGEVVRAISPSDSQTTYYGVVLSSQRAASSTDTSTSDTASVQIVTQVACSDGTERTFYHDGVAYSAGRLVSVRVDGGGTTVSSLAGTSLSGRISSDGSSFAGYNFADGVEILDTDSEGGYARIYPSRLAGATLQSDDVMYYALNENGEIDRLILRAVTGDTLTYVYLTSVTNNIGSMSVSGSYTYLLDGNSYTVNTSSAYNVSTGGAALLYDDGSLYRIRQLESVEITQLDQLCAMAGNRRYQMDESVQVILRSTGTTRGYYATTLSEINTEDYTITGWYDDLGYSAGGRIRILVAVPK